MASPPEESMFQFFHRSIMMNTSIKTYQHHNPPSQEAEMAIIQFLFLHLEKYGDAAADIQKAVDYALQKDNASPGGILIVHSTGNNITGAVVMNRTGMKDYIPEHILVYIATHKDYRGQGIGKALIEQAIASSEGNIALHVEPDNPAKKLYEQYGFTNKYLEMRLIK